MLYPEGKSGKKRIADDMMELIEKSFNLPRGWMDMLADGKAGATDHLEFAGNVRAGFVPVIGEAVFFAIPFQHFFLVLDTVAVTVICVVHR